MLPVDGEFILKVAPRFSGAKAEAQRRIVGAISGSFAQVLDSYDINTPLRVAHFMGQVTHECAGFRTTEEFASGEAYEGREDLGNVKPGDGPKFKGRGLLQLTGRANYREMGKILGLPLDEKPELAGDPVTSLRIACEYWQDRKINTPADNDDLREVTRRVNGGFNGLEDRRDYLRKAKIALAEMQGIAIGVEQGAGVPVLRRGSNSDAVGELQELLKAKGFGLTIDNDFGAATELAVKQFQVKAKLDADGIVGEETWAALRKK
jgi:putative chitinase